MKRTKALGSLQAIVITLMIIGIILGIGFLVLEEFEETLGTTTGTVVNETIAPTDAGIYVAYNHTTADVYCYHSFTPGIVTNESDGAIIASGNYSYTAATGLLKNLTSTEDDGAGGNSWNISYTYSYGDSAACEGLNETIEATKEIPVWLTIIVILLIVGILLAIVFKVLPTSGEGGVGGSFGGSSSDGITAEI